MFVSLLLLIGFVLFALPALVYANPNIHRQNRRERCGTISLKIVDRSTQQSVGNCPLYSSLSQFTPSPKIELHLPNSGILDLEPAIAFKAGSVRFSLDGYGSGVDNVAPFTLLDALPNAQITPGHAVVNVEFFSSNNAHGRLIKSLRVYLARYTEEEHSTGIPIVRLMCLERVQSETPTRLSTTAILEDGSLRAIATDDPKNGFIFGYSPDTSKGVKYPLMPSAEGDEPDVNETPLFAIDGTGYVSETYLGKRSTFVRFFDPTGNELMVKPLIRADYEVSIPMMTFFFPEGFGVRTWGENSEGESRFNYNGDTVAEKLFEGTIERHERLYVNDPNDGYYIQGLYWFVFCDVKGSDTSFGGAHPYIRRVATDSEISIGYGTAPYTELAPILPLLSDNHFFPWEETQFGGPDLYYGFNRACFQHSITGIETDNSSNAYVLYSLNSYNFMNESWPSAKITQLQKISPDGRLLWQKTLSGELWDQYFNVSYEFPGLVPVSLNWIKDRDILIIIGKAPGSGKLDQSGKSHYLAIFLDKEGTVINTQELGYLLPESDILAPHRSNAVTNPEKHQYYSLSEKLTTQSSSNEHWLTTLHVSSES
jgi:hypothetical protein